MNKFLFAFLLLLNFSAFGQKRLQGKFTQRSDYKSFTFFKNGTFTFVEGNDLYSRKGKGKYTIKKGIIKFSFTNSRLSNSFEINDIDCIDPNEEVIIITVVDKGTGKPMPGVPIQLREKHGQRNRITDENGKCTFGDGSDPGRGDFFDKFKDSTFIATIEPLRNFIYSLEYTTYSFEFKLRPCTHIKIALAEDSHAHNLRIGEETIWKYKIKKFKEGKSRGIILHGDTSIYDPKGYDSFFYKEKKKK